MLGPGTRQIGVHGLIDTPPGVHVMFSNSLSNQPLNCATNQPTNQPTHHVVIAISFQPPKSQQRLHKAVHQRVSIALFITVTCDPLSPAHLSISTQNPTFRRILSVCCRTLHPPITLHNTYCQIFHIPSYNARKVGRQGSATVRSG